MHVLLQEPRTAAKQGAVFVDVHVCAVLELCSVRHTVHCSVRHTVGARCSTPGTTMSHRLRNVQVCHSMKDEMRTQELCRQAARWVPGDMPAQTT